MKIKGMRSGVNGFAQSLSVPVALCLAIDEIESRVQSFVGEDEVRQKQPSRSCRMNPVPL